MDLPEGVRVGHATDREGWTGCTVILPPAGTVAAGEGRGGGPGTRESDLLSPASGTPGGQGLLFTGGSAYGPGAAEGGVAHPGGTGQGFPAPGGPRPPGP